MIERLKLYVDMDGVLVDFDKGYAQASGGNKPRGDDEFWDVVLRTPDFWINLEPMPDAMELWDYVKRHHYVVLLSSPGTHDAERACRQKRQWVRKHLGDDVNIILKNAKEKHHYAHATSLLIDDWHRNIERWLNAGGVAIHHKSAKETIAKLEELGLKHVG